VSVSVIAFSFNFLKSPLLVHKKNQPIRTSLLLGVVVHNPNCLGGRDWEDCDSKSADLKKQADMVCSYVIRGLQPRGWSKAKVPDHVGKITKAKKGWGMAQWLSTCLASVRL
jgi:hypothetical protein